MLAVGWVAAIVACLGYGAITFTVEMVVVSIMG